MNNDSTVFIGKVPMWGGPLDGQDVSYRVVSDLPMFHPLPAHDGYYRLDLHPDLTPHIYRWRQNA